MSRAVQPRAEQPFLAPRALLALALIPPLLTMVTIPLGGEQSIVHTVGCLLSQWASTVLLGGLLHGLVSFGAPWAMRLVRPRALGLAAIVALALAVVVGGLLLVLPRLAALGHGIDQHLATFVVSGAVGLAAIYLIGARAGAVLQTHARSQSARVLASEEDAQRNRMAALQSQMNPHFLFNSLNSVASLIHAEPTVAESMVEQLSGVLQYAITAGQRETVKLGEELENVRDYLGVEQARFGARLRSAIEVSPELYDQSIPPMLLQPLVENAVLHGLSTREQGGEVRITGHLDGGEVVLVVSDDGVGPGGSTRRGNRVGLSSVRERIALTYGPTGAFHVRPRTGGGFECELRLPRVHAA